MKVENTAQSLFDQLKSYKKKYYTNLLVRGLLIALALVGSTYILFNALEYLGRFNTMVRGLFFFGFLALCAYVLFSWIIEPLSRLFKLNRQISDEEAARQIGKYFPDVDDKLLNTIQLNTSSGQDNSLLQATIQQRTQDLSVFNFSEAVQLSENRRYLRYALPPVLFLFFFFVIAPQSFRDFFGASSHRIINYQLTFADPAPFTFNLLNEELEAFKNEDFVIRLKMEGQAIPAEVYIHSGERRYKLSLNEEGDYEYRISKIQKPMDFYFDAAGFRSNTYSVELIERPTLLSFKASLSYPAYLGKPNESWENIGNLVVPEGTQIQWLFSTNQSDKLELIFSGSKDTIAAQKQSSTQYAYQKPIRSSENYQIRLENEHSSNKEEISYYISVVPDRYPKISMQEYEDTATYNFLSLGGSVSDDYGLSQLKLFYRINRDEQTPAWSTAPIPLNNNQSIQNYFFEMPLQNLNLQPGDKIEYYTQVWDNDGVNGPKSSRSTMRQFNIPTRGELKEEIDQSVAETENTIDKTLKKAQNLQKDIDNLENKLRNKQKLDYQDKKLAEDILKKREDLMQEIQKLQEQNQNINEKQERFSELDEQVAEKMEQLQQLMDELMDEETKKLYEELKKLLEQNRNNDAVLDKLEEINQKESFLEKELERALEMFKQLQFEQKLEETIDELEELAEDQKELSEQSEKLDEQKGNDESKSEEAKEIEEKQEDINEKFEELQEEMEELEELDQDLENPNGMKENNEDMQNEQMEISEEMKKALEQLQKQQMNKAGKSQKNAGEQMQKMAEQMGQMQSSMQMEQMMEDMDDLRAILENLVKLSFDQEQLMKDFKNVNLSDPRFIQLAQQQLKLRDDAKIIEDSLQALAKRVFQIQSFVTREVGEMNNYMDESSDMIKQRKLGNAISKQQFAMTSMNNLALMLSDVLQQMQQAMQNAMAMPSQGKGKPQKSPNLSKLQQSLGQKIDQLKRSGKTGRELSEELAKLAAEQERIRRALQELQKMTGGDAALKEKLAKQIQEIQKEMEKNEEDLVNKRIQNISKERLKKIETRLLESEKAVKEQGEEEQRKADQAKDKTKKVPPSLEQYLRNKEKQIELLKTIPPALSPYYKKEVDEYFEKIDK